jgi:hypothetical protein
LIEAESSTLHEPISPNTLYLDRTTGNGLFVHSEYPIRVRVRVVVPGEDVPLCMSTVSSMIMSSDNLTFLSDILLGQMGPANVEAGNQADPRKDQGGRAAGWDESGT